MRGASHLPLGLVAPPLLILACSSLEGLVSSPSPDAGTDAFVDAPTAPPDDAGSDAPTSDACVDPQTDPRNCGRCGHDCLGGACTAGVCQPGVFAANESSPRDITANARRVEWLSGAGNTSLLRGCPSTGCAVAAEDYRATAPSILRALTSDEEYAYVFVANGSGGSSSVVRSPSDGGVSSTFSTSGSPEVHAIATNAQRVFILGDYMIGIPKNGGPGNLVAGPLQSGDAAAPNALAATDDSAFFCNDVECARVPLGNNAPPVYLGAIAPGVRIVTDGTSIFWADKGNFSLQGRILTCDVNCVHLGWTTLVTGLDGPVGLAVDATYVYFTNPSAGTIQRCPKTAPCSPTTIASNQGGASSIAVNDRALYWTLPGDGVTPGRVMVLAK